MRGTNAPLQLAQSSHPGYADAMGYNEGDALSGFVREQGGMVVSPGEYGGDLADYAGSGELAAGTDGQGHLQTVTFKGVTEVVNWKVGHVCFCVLCVCVCVNVYMY